MLLFSNKYSIYNDTHLDVPIFLINLNILNLSKYGIFFPFVANLLEYKRYIFSCFFPGLYLINGICFVVFTNLKTTSNGILKELSG